MGPFFLTTSNVLPGLDGFDIWIQAIDHGQTAKVAKVQVDWLVVQA
jgi:hypothetical protein